MKDEALKLALEALINAIAVRNGEGGTKRVSPLEENAITAIKEALAQPPQREWVGLTDADIENCIHVIEKKGINVFDLVKAIEAKLKEKNT